MSFVRTKITVKVNVGQQQPYVLGMTKLLPVKFLRLVFVYELPKSWSDVTASSVTQASSESQPTQLTHTQMQIPHETNAFAFGVIR